MGIQCPFLTLITCLLISLCEVLVLYYTNCALCCKRGDGQGDAWGAPFPCWQPNNTFCLWATLVAYNLGAINSWMLLRKKKRSCTRSHSIPPLLWPFQAGTESFRREVKPLKFHPPKIHAESLVTPSPSLSNSAASPPPPVYACFRPSLVCSFYLLPAICNSHLFLLLPCTSCFLL